MRRIGRAATAAIFAGILLAGCSTMKPAGCLPNIELTPLEPLPVFGTVYYFYDVKIENTGTQSCAVPDSAQGSIVNSIEVSGPSATLFDSVSFDERPELVPIEQTAEVLTFAYTNELSIQESFLYTAVVQVEKCGEATGPREISLFVHAEPTGFGTSEEEAVSVPAPSCP